MSVFSVGQYVDVDYKSNTVVALTVAYIKTINKETDCCNLVFVVDKRTERNVKFD